MRCGDPRVSELSGGSCLSRSRSRNRNSSRERERERDAVEAGRIVGGEGQVVFEIGDDDDDYNVGGVDDLPPAYDAVHDANTTGDDRISSEARSHDGVPTSLSPSPPPRFTPAQPESTDEEVEYEMVEVRHTLKRNEGILGIARKYAADVSVSTA